MIITFAQGMDLLQHASQAYGYGLDLHSIAGIWRGGCIIRAALLEPIRKAYQDQPALPNLLFDPILGAQETGKRIPPLRRLIGKVSQAGVPIPAFMASLGYYDSLRSAWLPANLIQAQRDYFGAHTYERVDERGIFHTQWEES
jgi:6-phosphogluconate dehydrogenase